MAWWSLLSLPVASSTKTTTTVGIIGGGISALGAARRLSLSPDRFQVTILEKGAEVVPLQHRVHRNGRTHDMDLIYIPALSWEGHGIEKRWKQLLDSYGPTQLLKASEFYHGMKQVDKRGNVFANFENLSENEALGYVREIAKFVETLQPYFARHQYSGVSECIQSGLGLANETFGDWCDRHEFYHFSQLSGEMMALYGNVPVHESPTCQVLTMVSNKATSMLGPLFLLMLKTLSDMGTDPMQHDIAIPEVLQLWMAGLTIHGVDSFLFSYKHGYANFFQKVVKEAGIDYRTNMKVAKVQPNNNTTDGGGVNVWLTDGSVLHYDQVIVATRPDQALGFLPSNHPMVPLYSAVAQASQDRHQQFGIYAVALLDAKFSPGSHLEERLADHPGEYVLNAPDFMGPAGGLDVAVQPNSIHPFRIVKQFHDSPLITVTFQVDQALVGTTAETETLVSFLSHVGYQDMELVRIQHYPGTPSYVPVDQVAQGWYQRAEKAQGIDSLHFVGEVFSGHGIPTTWLYTEDYVEKVFYLGCPSVEQLAPTRPQSSQRQTTRTAVIPSFFDTALDSFSGRMMQTVTQRPDEALDLGVPPVLLVDWTKEYGVMPYTFIWFLLSAYVLLELLGRYFRCSCAQAVPETKIRHVSVYSLELLVSTKLLGATFLWLDDLLFFRPVKDVAATTSAASGIVVAMNGLYLAELFYHSQMRTSLRAHHICCVLMLQCITYVYVQEKLLSILRLGMYNVLFALTEQNVFIVMLVYRLRPKWLFQHPVVCQLSATAYLVTRIAIGLLNLWAWTDLWHMDSTMGATDFLKVTFPILLFVQMLAQWKCFRGLKILAGKVQLG